jgi:hypothetical protein
MGSNTAAGFNRDLRQDAWKYADIRLAICVSPDYQKPF